MRVRALALAGVSALLLTACGSDSSDDGTSSPPFSSGPSTSAQSGPELVAAAADALEEAGSVRLEGNVPTGQGQTDVDLRLSGEEAAGSMSVEGQTIGVIVADGSAYLQADGEFWADQGAPASVVDRLDGAWVLAPSDSGVGLGGLTVPRLAEELRQPSEGTIEDEVTSGEVDGEPVWEIRSSDGAVLRVAAEGTPYPLVFERSGDEAGVMRLSEFGAVEPIEAPEDFLDLSDLGG